MKIYSVSAFNRGISIWLEKLPAVWVEGEVTVIRRADAWANVFFTLKDPETGATLDGTIPRRRFDQLDLALAIGDRIRVEGRCEIYEAKGSISFRATAIEHAGLGEHLAALERLKRKLALEGLFATERKRPLPRFPRAVGLLTGTEAAARGDIEHAMASRFPIGTLVVREARVQGPAAPAAIVRGLEALSRHPLVDVVVLARGGGSFEDLLPFSDERVVRAVARCPVPVVSAVGHEQDTPLCDLAADARASTPTAAVRLVVPDLAELRSQVTRMRDRLGRSVGERLRRDRDRLETARRRLAEAPARDIERRRARLDQAGARLQALSPEATLQRGYAIVRHDGRALRAAVGIAVGDAVDIRLASGRLAAAVVGVYAPESR